MRLSGIQLNKRELKKYSHGTGMIPVSWFFMAMRKKDRSIFLLLLLFLCYNQAKHILQNLHDSFAIYILRTTD